jgi:hypothetical protein
LEPQAIRVHEGRSGQCLVTAEQDDMGLGRRTSPARCGCIDAALSALQWVGGIANMLKCPSRASCGFCVVVVVDNNSMNLQKPLQVDRFWRRY